MNLLFFGKHSFWIPFINRFICSGRIETHGIMRTELWILVIRRYVVSVRLSRSPQRISAVGDSTYYHNFYTMRSSQTSSTSDRFSYFRKIGFRRFLEFASSFETQSSKSDWSCDRINCDGAATMKKAFEKFKKVKIFTKMKTNMK